MKIEFKYYKLRRYQLLIAKLNHKYYYINTLNNYMHLIGGLKKVKLATSCGGERLLKELMEGELWKITKLPLSQRMNTF